MRAPEFVRLGFLGFCPQVRGVAALSATAALPPAAQPRSRSVYRISTSRAWPRAAVRRRQHPYVPACVAVHWLLRWLRERRVRPAMTIAIAAARQAQPCHRRFPFRCARYTVSNAALPAACAVVLHEFRIPLPLSVDEFRRGQLHMVRRWEPVGHCVCAAICA